MCSHQRIYKHVGQLLEHLADVLGAEFIESSACPGGLQAVLLERSESLRIR